MHAFLESVEAEDMKYIAIFFSNLVISLFIFFYYLPNELSGNHGFFHETGQAIKYARKRAARTQTSTQSPVPVPFFQIRLIVKVSNRPILGYFLFLNNRHDDSTISKNK